MIVRRLLAAAALLGLSALSACNYDDLIPADQPLPAALVSQIKANGMGINSPILVRLFKEESQLEVWKQKTDGTYALLKTYPICAWSGKLGPKTREGDRQAPEGFYNVTPAQMNPNSNYHLAVNIGYPNTFDQANGRTGTHLMVHGSCSSSGCYAMDDEQIQEIYSMARDAFKGGQRSFQIQAFPFRMTPKNMARHRNSEHYAFWKMLKAGSDQFAVDKRPVSVGVCERRYVFGQGSDDVAELNPVGPCPSISVSPLVASRISTDAAEEQKFASAMAPSEFAETSTFSYQTGQAISAEAYAQEQHRRAGFDPHGKRIGASAFSSFLE